MDPIKYYPMTCYLLQDKVMTSMIATHGDRIFIYDKYSSIDVRHIKGDKEMNLLNGVPHGLTKVGDIKIMFNRSSIVHFESDDMVYCKEYLIMKSDGGETKFYLDNDIITNGKELKKIGLPEDAKVKVKLDPETFELSLRIELGE